MVFSTTTLFKDIACPYGEQCSLTSCIFSHELRPKRAAKPGAEAISATSAPSTRGSEDAHEPPHKRRRVAYEKAVDKPPSKADNIRAELAQARTAKSDVLGPSTFTSSIVSNDSVSADHRTPASLQKAVSPPPTNSSSPTAGSTKGRSDNSKQANANPGPNATTRVNQTLNPRLIAFDPAGHAKRSLYLKHLHAELVRLNRLVAESKDLKHKDLLFLNEQELIKLALDEEEGLAKRETTIYENKIKQRIAFYRKMRVDEWAQHVKTTRFQDRPEFGSLTNGNVLDTGLTAGEELQILPHLVAEQSSLKPFGYIPTPPTETEAAEAAAAVEASLHYEVCDRCSARFQVYPDRSSEGKLTSNGPCRHHPNKKVYPQKTKGDVASGLSKEPYHPCCNGLVGSPGCTLSPDHVFKASSPGRLAAVLPFMTTPENHSPATDKRGHKVRAVTFDCEMGYTTMGLELIRLTAVSWPAGEELVDVLVRPLGTIIELNSRFSGVWPEHITNAIPYEDYASTITKPTVSPEPKDGVLPIVESPQKARELLCSFLTPKTPLLGHAIDNDLNATRLCHPTIVDTIVLYPHPRGLPMRFGLKMLSNKFLGRSIQTGGDREHDSLEDAQATGDLVRVKVVEKWKLLNAQGWKFVEGKLVPPPPAPAANGMQSNAGGDYAHRMAARMVEGQATGKKRRKRRPGEQRTESESTEDEEVRS